MPKTIDKKAGGQIIGGTFSNPENADAAIAAFRKLGVPDHNVQVIVQVHDKEPDPVYTDILTDRGFADTQAHFYSSAIREGKVLVVVYNVADPVPIIDIFDQHKAEYNPNGSRDMRDDVAGMTVGAAVGAVAGGIAGAAVGGPLGAAAGSVAGAVLGGGGGAAAGKAAEHKK